MRHPIRLLGLLLLMTFHAAASEGGVSPGPETEVRAHFGGHGAEIVAILRDPELVQAFIAWIAKEKIVTPDRKLLGAVTPFTRIEILEKKNDEWVAKREISIYANYDSSNDTFHTTVEQRKTLLSLLGIDQFEYYLQKSK